MYVCARIPSYKDVVGEDTAEVGGANTDSIESGEGEGEGQLVSSDDEEVERQEQFEREYNFRFEEPGGTDVSKHNTHHPPSTMHMYVLIVALLLAWTFGSKRPAMRYSSTVVCCSTS